MYEIIPICFCSLFFSMLSSLDPAGWHDGPPGAAVLPQAAAALVLPQGPAVPDQQAAAPGTGHAASGHVDNVPQILLII